MPGNDHLQAYEKRLQQELTNSFTPNQILDRMIKDYQERISGYSIVDDGDMLLFQSGVYDWGQGKKLEIDFARQFIQKSQADSDPEVIIQLHITAYFPVPDDEKHEEVLWLHDPKDSQDWLAKVKSSAIMKEYGDKTPTSIKIACEDVD